MLSREQMLKKLHLRDEYYRRRGRQSFAEFIRYTKPDYQLSWFHEELALELEKFLEDVLEKRSPRLIINVPPQEGKSEKLEQAVNQRLERAPELSENGLRNLAVVSEAAQRISRLALGAATENIHTDPYAQMSDAELAAELNRLGLESVQ